MENQNKPKNLSAYPSDWDINSGMTLRDYFAGQYLQGHISSEYYAGCNTTKENVIGIAKASYLFADAMLNERTL